MGRSITELSDRGTDDGASAVPQGTSCLDGRRSSPQDSVAPLRPSPARREGVADLPLARRDRSAAEKWSHNLPHPITSFIGREQEIAEARRLLSETRLLTLTGAGGVGKTRLGLEVATSLLDHSVHAAPARRAATGPAYRGGIWLVELAGLTDPTQVPEAVAAVLDVQEEPGRRLIE